jgi:hypothetical protein
MLTLKSVHIVLIGISIVLTAWAGAWGLHESHPIFGAVSLTAGLLLVLYLGYFGYVARRTHLP